MSQPLAFTYAESVQIFLSILFYRACPHKLAWLLSASTLAIMCPSTLLPKLSTHAHGVSVRMLALSLVLASPVHAHSRSLHPQADTPTCVRACSRRICSRKHTKPLSKFFNPDISRERSCRIRSRLLMASRPVHARTMFTLVRAFVARTFAHHFHSCSRLRSPYIRAPYSRLLAFFAARTCAHHVHVCLRLSGPYIRVRLALNACHSASILPASAICTI